MSRNRIPFHIQRSLLLLDTIKHTTGLKPAEIGDTVRKQVYAPMKKLSEAPSPETIKAYFAGDRPIPFDPPGASKPSWLMAVADCFPGSWRYFFHPVLNLLAGPIRSSEKTRARSLRYPDSWIQEAERLGDDASAREYRTANAKLDARARVRSPKSDVEDSLKWIHANMYALVPEARKALLAMTGLARGWHRRFNPVEKEIADLQCLPPLETLAAAFALHLEANQIRDSARSEATRLFVLEQLPRMDSDPSLRRVRKVLDMALRHELTYSSFARYDPEWIVVQVLPDSWRGPTLNAMRNERFVRKVSRR